MACIAQEKHAAVPPALGEQRMKAIDGGAPDLDAGRIDEAGDLLHDVLVPAEFLGLLSGEQLDLPAAQIAGPGDEGRRPRRPAILDASRRQIHRTPDPHVDDHPPLVEPQILQRDVETACARSCWRRRSRAECAPRRTRSSPCATSRTVSATPSIVLREGDTAVAEEHIDRRARRRHPRAAASRPPAARMCWSAARREDKAEAAARTS